MHMQNKKIFIYVFVPVIIIIIVSLIITFCISPVKRITLPNSSNNGINTVLKTPEKITFDAKDSQLNVSISLTEEELNNIIYSSIKNKMNVNGIETNISNSDMIIYINTYLFHSIQTQCILTLVPSKNVNEPVFILKSVEIGRISLPKSFVINQLKRMNFDNLFIDTTNNSISINSKQVEPFKINNISTENGNLKLSLNYQIKSLQDVVRLFENNLPDNIKNYVKVIWR